MPTINNAPLGISSFYNLLTSTKIRIIRIGELMPTINNVSLGISSFYDLLTSTKIRIIRIGELMCGDLGITKELPTGC